MRCSVKPGSAGQIALMLLLCIALVAFLLYMQKNAKHPQDTDGLPVKIFIDFSQMLSSLSIFGVLWSDEMLNVFDTASTANMGAGVGSITCVSVPYKTSLIVNILSPLLIFCILASALVITRMVGLYRKAHQEKLSIVLGRAVMVVMFLTYASVASATMSFFHCDTLGEGRRFLIADYTLDCESQEYYALMPWAILGCLITTLIPLLWFFGMIWVSNNPRVHLKFTTSGKRGRCYRVAGSMYAAFIPNSKTIRLREANSKTINWDIAVSWEAVRMIRKAGLIALSVFYSLPKYRSAQLCLGLVWLNMHMVVL